jgi:hypothetical protein
MEMKKINSGRLRAIGYKKRLHAQKRLGAVWFIDLHKEIVREE